jgi:hypothetical protein
VWIEPVLIAADSVDYLSARRFAIKALTSDQANPTTARAATVNNTKRTPWADEFGSTDLRAVSRPTRAAAAAKMISHRR